ncbi:taste receptor type 1 member 2 [Tachyglossus aculeatus]|uniref:taste receptor type 1 member 2 n=1 Tax=Tachyglossus aculeatus TaxID=9261 RepID=UPI0018F63D0B|nr:taste receptor type 1 member 2 [Tachyglossus aculeatus]
MSARASGSRGRFVRWVVTVLAGLGTSAATSDFHLAGDYVLGGLFALHANMKATAPLDHLSVPRCKNSEVRVVGYNLLQAMRFAVEEINNHSSLLPGITLGYEILDVCYITNNIQPAFYLLSNNDYLLPILHSYHDYQPRVVAVIGPGTSEAAVTMGDLFSLFFIPQIAYSASSQQLRNPNRFSNIFRTNPHGPSQVEAMIHLLVHFGWNWVIVILSSDDYGQESGRLISDRLPKDICIAFQEFLPRPSQPDRRQLENVVRRIKESTARVVMVMSPDMVLRGFFREVVRQNLTSTVWIASESWAVDPILYSLPFIHRAGTFLGVTTQSVNISSFHSFRIRRTREGPEPANRTASGETCNQECEACLGTIQALDDLLTRSGERLVYNVYSGVYVVAHALHRLLACNLTSCRKKVVYPWQLLKQVGQVNFSLLGHQISFDRYGDPIMDLEIIQWQWNSGKSSFRSVALYRSEERRLRSLGWDITWHTPNNAIPFSICSNKCGRGQWKKPVGVHSCCFECKSCEAGTYFNESEEFGCLNCPETQWSLPRSTECFQRRLVFLDWHEGPTIVLIVFATLGFLSTLAIVAIFGLHLQTPMVRSAGGKMCFLMLAPLAVGFAFIPVHIGKPTEFMCLCRQTVFTLCFTVCIACIAVRSFQIVCIFKMARKWPRAYHCWLKYHGPYVFVALFTTLKVVIIATNVIASNYAPTTRLDPEDANVMILTCDPNYKHALLSNTGLDLVLSVVGFLFAYMGKELPTNYNEAKFITLSMTFYFTSSVSLCTFMSVYEGVLVTIFDAAVTVVNLLGISLGYFAPKCYMILFHPERNTSSYFQNMIQGYTMRQD